MTDNKLPRTETESLLDIALDDLGGVEVLQGLDFSQLSDTQRTAVDLHKRGLNVFPIPRGHKEPYILRPLFYGRLHRCGHSCKIRHAPNLESLFDMQNIAVMMGRTSENLFAIDCDTQADFRGMAAELDRRGLPYWAYTSRRGGSYLMRLAEGEAKNKTLKGWEHVEIWGSMHYVILPPSIHPSGELYRWKTSDPYRLPIDEKPPLVSIQALDWLEVERATTGAKWEDTELLGLPAWTSTLSRNNRKILAQAIDGGLAEGVRNTTLRNPTYDIAAMIDAGLIDYATGLDLLEEAAAGCEYPIKSIRGMLKSALDKPGLELARKGGRTQAGEWQKALSFAQVHNWKEYGRTQHTDKAVFIACCERARLDAGKGSFRASAREIGNLSNKTAKTTSKALKRLVVSDLLTPTKRDKSGANRFSLGGVVRGYYTTPTCSYSVVTTNHQKTTVLQATEAEQDVFGRLGAVSWAVYMALQETYYHNHKEIAEAARVSRQSVKRVLSRGKNTGVLIQYGLVIYNPTDNTYHAEQATEDRLERIAASLDVLGRTAKRKRKYKAEREMRTNRFMAGAMAKDARNYINRGTK